VPVSTFDYYRWRQRRNKQALVAINLRAAGMGLGSHGGAGQEPVAVVLRNGRRVKIGWNDLGRVAGQSQLFRALLDCLEGASPDLDVYCGVPETRKRPGLITALFRGMDCNA